jgi:hypothetical protein
MSGGDKKHNVIQLTPGTADEVGTKLKNSAKAIEDSTFKNAHIASGALSTVDKAAVLQSEHETTQYILNETLAGFVTDLKGFAEAVTHSADGLTDSDADTATMFNRLAAIVPTNHDDRRHDTAWRNQGAH